MNDKIQTEKPKSKDRHKYIKVLIIAMVIVIFGIIYLSKAYMRNDSYFKYKPFFEDDTEYDVLFFGSSHMVDGVYPMQLWNDYGITSYNCGNHGSHVPASVEFSKIVFKYHKPKIAVLDVFYVNSQEYGYDSLGQVHNTIDILPVNKDKLDMIKTIYPDDKKAQAELANPFSIYHSRWNETNRAIIKRGFGMDLTCTTEKGSAFRSNIVEPKNMKRIPESSYTKETSPGLEYVKEFIEYCRERKIEPVIINIPSPTNETNQMWANAAIKLAKEEGVPTINFQYTDTVDFDTDLNDFSENNSHLNSSGARKVTDELGKFLTETFELEDKRNDPAYDNWDQDYEEYYDFLVSNIKNYDDYKTTLLLLNNSNFKAELAVTGKYDADKVEEKLIKQLGGNIKLIDTEVIMANGNSDADIKLTIYNKESGEELISKYYDVDEKIELINKM